MAWDRNPVFLFQTVSTLDNFDLSQRQGPASFSLVWLSQANTLNLSKFKYSLAFHMRALHHGDSTLHHGDSTCFNYVPWDLLFPLQSFYSTLKHTVPVWLLIYSRITCRNLLLVARLSCWLLGILGKDYLWTLYWK